VRAALGHWTSAKDPAIGVNAERCPVEQARASNRKDSEL
jgi:hypothetical protein